MRPRRIGFRPSPLRATRVKKSGLATFLP